VTTWENESPQYVRQTGEIEKKRGHRLSSLWVKGMTVTGWKACVPFWEISLGLTNGETIQHIGWALGAGRWALGAGRWALGAGRWAHKAHKALCYQSYGVAYSHSFLPLKTG